MSHPSVHCPHCRTGLKILKTLSVAKKCPRCGHKFTIPTSAALIPIARPAPPSMPSTALQGRPPTATAAAWTRRFVFAGIVGCGIVVLGLVVACWAGPEEAPPPVAAPPVAPPPVLAYAISEIDPSSNQALPLPEKKNPVMAVATTPTPPAGEKAALEPAGAETKDLAVLKPTVKPAQAPVAEDILPAQKKVDPALPELKIALTGEEQRLIHQAIAQGVRYLKGSLAAVPMEQARADDEGAHGRHATGRMSLAGLTLLECGVPGNDPAVVKAARVVRRAAPQLRDTYSLSLAILFLDRLGEPEDQKRIRTFAARLIAGQNSHGGWTYACPHLTAPEEEILLTMLQDLPPLKTILSRPGTPQNPLLKEKVDLQQPIPSQGSWPLPNPLPKGPSLERGLVDPLGNLRNPLPARESDWHQPIQKQPSSPAGPLPAPVNPDSRNQGMERLRGPNAELPLILQKVPALRVQAGKEFKLQDHHGSGDNSNTQFAILGLWAARQHGVPMERPLVLVERRFRGSQNADGSWGYQNWGRKQPDSMTCTGLLGMALALGVDLQLQGQKAGPALADPAVQKGLAYLSTTIGKTPPPAWGKGKGKHAGRWVGADSHGDLYYLWSVERVAVAYRLPTMAEKDWYRWGASVIVNHQQADGSWKERYAGIPDTSFALLFLSRANLVRGLPPLVARSP